MVLFAWGCAAPTGALADSGTPEGEDAGVEDGGTFVADAGSFDAGPFDAGLDAGVADAGTSRLFIFTGSGSGQIRVFGFDSNDGGLTPLGISNAGNGSSFLAIDLPHGRLYATNESSNQVAAFALDTSDAGLQFLNRVSSGGAGPAHVSVDGTGRFVLVANYNAGTIAVLPAILDGGLGAATQTLSPGGQAHQIFTDPTNGFAYVPCKAADHLAQYSFDAGTLSALSPSVMDTATGAGPRHLALHPSLPRAYLINELDSTLQTLARANSGALTSLQTVSTLPVGFAGTNTGAEVAVHPNGRFVFGSNRGHDSIATFSVDGTTGLLTLVGHTPTEGMTPRHFSLDPTGRWMVVGNQGSNTLTLFAVDRLTGALSSRGVVAAVTGPTFARFVELP